MHFLGTTTVFSLLLLSVSAFPFALPIPHHHKETTPTTSAASTTATPAIAAIPAASPSSSSSSTAKAATAPLTIPPSLVPIFSIKTGSGVGANGVLIPKTCPPSRADFIAKLTTNVAAGKVLALPITFNTNASVTDVATQKARATAMIITLQSFTGVFGVGCPGASVPELIAQQKTGVEAAS